MINWLINIFYIPLLDLRIIFINNNEYKIIYSKFNLFIKIISKFIRRFIIKIKYGFLMKMKANKYENKNKIAYRHIGNDKYNENE